MRRKGPNVTYTFVNPNSPGSVQKMLKAVIVEKLLAVKQENRGG